MNDGGWSKVEISIKTTNRSIVLKFKRKIKMNLKADYVRKNILQWFNDYNGF